MQYKQTTRLSFHGAIRHQNDGMVGMGCWHKPLFCSPNRVPLGAGFGQRPLSSFDCSLKPGARNRAHHLNYTAPALHQSPIYWAMPGHRQRAFPVTVWLDFQHQTNIHSSGAELFLLDVVVPASVHWTKRGRQKIRSATLAKQAPGGLLDLAASGGSR